MIGQCSMKSMIAMLILVVHNSSTSVDHLIESSLSNYCCLSSFHLISPSICDLICCNLLFLFMIDTTWLFCSKIRLQIIQCHNNDIIVAT